MFADTPSWLIDSSLWAGSITAFIVSIKVFTGWAPFRWVWHRLVHQPVREGLRAVVKDEVTPMLTEVLGQVLPNHGTSFRDALDVLDTRIGVFEREVRGSLKVMEAQACDTLTLAGHAVVGIDGLKDRATEIEAAVAEAATLTADVKRDLDQFNEVDQLGAEGRIDRRHNQDDLTGRLDAIHDELRTLNDKTVGEIVEGQETRRIEEIPEDERTLAEIEHLEVTDTKETP